MYRRLFTIFIVLGFTAAFAQETHEVEMYIVPIEGRPLPEFFFQPVGLFIEPGDTVSFIALSPHHTATAYHEQHGKSHRVPDGVEPFSSPIVPIGESWEYTFEVPGVYDIWCGPHEQYGMAMRIVVGEATGPATEPPDNFGPDGTFGASGMVLSDPALDPENIIEQGQVMWEELEAETRAGQAMMEEPEQEEPEQGMDDEEEDEGSN